jgi:SAM-dependent methyltransferase
MIQQRDRDDDPRRGNPDMNSSWRRTGVRGEHYDARFAALERAGHEMHGEADFVQSLGAGSVLDAGCGTGRVAIELARRGLSVAGIDRDADMIQTARQKAPTLDWFEQNIASYTIPDSADPAQPRRFDAIVMAGNVMIFLDPGTEAYVVANLARHLAPGGKLIAGFQLQPRGLDVAHYDAYAASAGLIFVERWATWERVPWSEASDYAVSVHQRSS